MRRGEEDTLLVLDREKEYHVLFEGIQQTNQGEGLGYELVYSLTPKLSGLRWLAPELLPEGDGESFKVKPENLESVEQALQGVLAVGGLKGAFIGLIGEKRLARRMLRAIYLPPDGSHDGSLLKWYPIIC